MVNLATHLPRSSRIRHAAEQVAYAVRYDAIVERESGLKAEQRTGICIAMGHLDYGRLEEARRAVASLDADTRRNPFVQDLEARVSWFLGDKEAAVQLWHAALDNNPDYRLRARIVRYLSVIDDLA